MYLFLWHLVTFFFYLFNPFFLLLPFFFSCHLSPFRSRVLEYHSMDANTETGISQTPPYRSSGLTWAFFLPMVKNGQNEAQLWSAVKSWPLYRFLRSARQKKGNRLNFQNFLEKSRFWHFFGRFGPQTRQQDFQGANIGCLQIENSFKGRKVGKK